MANGNWIGSDKPTPGEASAGPTYGTWDTSSEAGAVIHSVLLGRVVLVHVIAVLPDYNIVRFEYEVVPGAEPPPPDGADPEPWTAWESRNHWWVTADDDLGTEYDDTGGAYRNSPDGSRAEGELDLYPIPPSAATWLNITFHGGDVHRADHPRYILRASLPLPTLSLKEWTSLTRRYWICD
ncbi:MAG: hypothetical protein ACR2JC_11145 [Chloroflexota bacterium]